MSIRLRPVVEEDLAMFRRFATEPGLIGLDWTGFKWPDEALGDRHRAAAAVAWKRDRLAGAGDGVTVTSTAA
jgi:hypothetical protein